MQQSDYSLYFSFFLFKDTQRQHLRGRYMPFTTADKCQDSELISDIHYVTIILIAFVQCWVTNGFALA